MISLDRLAHLVLALPETTMEDHHGMDSYRVRGRIFATVPDERHVRVMLEPEAISAAVAENPAACAPLLWGKRLACVVVDLVAADDDLIDELITEAWKRKAPAALVRRWAEPAS